MKEEEDISGKGESMCKNPAAERTMTRQGKVKRLMCGKQTHRVVWYQKSLKRWVIHISVGLTGHAKKVFVYV